MSRLLNTFLRNYRTRPKPRPVARTARRTKRNTEYLSKLWRESWLSRGALRLFLACQRGAALIWDSDWSGWLGELARAGKPARSRVRLACEPLEGREIPSAGPGPFSLAEVDT